MSGTRNGNGNQNGNGHGTTPERMTLWFADDESVGLDVRWAGPAGVRRASLAHNRLRSAGHPVTITEDELGWKISLGPIDRVAITEILSRFLLRQ